MSLTEKEAAFDAKLIAVQKWLLRAAKISAGTGIIVATLLAAVLLLAGCTRYGSEETPITPREPLPGVIDQNVTEVQIKLSSGWVVTCLKFGTGDKTPVSCDWANKVSQ